MDVFVQKRDVFGGNAVMAYNKVKRFLVVHFRVGHVRQSLGARAGACDQCGLCCKIVFDCPFLARKEDHTVCRIYKFRPLQCRAFPFNETDLKDVDRCSFRFEKGRGE